MIRPSISCHSSEWSAELSDILSGIISVNRLLVPALLVAE